MHLAFLSPFGLLKSHGVSQLQSSPLIKSRLFHSTRSMLEPRSLQIFDPIIPEILYYLDREDQDSRLMDSKSLGN